MAEQTLKCSDVEALIDDYTADQVTQDQSNALEGHLASCNDCREKFQTAEQAVELVSHTLRSLNPKENFEDTVSSKIVELRESSAGIQPVEADVKTAELTAEAPENALIKDPAEAEEKKRLVMISVAAVGLFIIVIAILILMLMD